MGKNLFAVGLGRHAKEYTQGGNWIQVNFYLQTFPAANRNGAGTLGVGDVWIVGEGISHVERSIELCGRLQGPGIGVAYSEFG